MMQILMKDITNGFKVMSDLRHMSPDIANFWTQTENASKYTPFVPLNFKNAFSKLEK